MEIPAPCPEILSPFFPLPFLALPGDFAPLMQEHQEPSIPMDVFWLETPLNGCARLKTPLNGCVWHKTPPLTDGLVTGNQVGTEQRPVTGPGKGWSRMRSESYCFTGIARVRRTHSQHLI